MVPALLVCDLKNQPEFHQKNPRVGWAEAAKQAHENGDDKLLISDVFEGETSLLQDRGGPTLKRGRPYSARISPFL